MGKEKDQRALKAFLEGIRALADALPSEAEKEEARSRLSQLVEFLSDMRSRLASVPSREDAAQARIAIEELEGLLSKANANPVLAAALGLRKAERKRPRTEAPSYEENSRAKEALSVLEALPADEIQTSLRDEEKYSTSRLRAIALQLGIRATSKTSREALIHQIATRIANYRGYQDLSGQPKANQS
jgi:hypothetical protein